MKLTVKYKFINHVREYWYIGSMFARSEMQKKRMDECTATGRYPFLVSSISFSVVAAICCLAEISSARILDEDSTLMARSSSKMFPWRKKENNNDNIDGRKKDASFRKRKWKKLQREAKNKKKEWEYEWLSYKSCHIKITFILALR